MKPDSEDALENSSNLFKSKFMVTFFFTLTGTCSGISTTSQFLVACTISSSGFGGSSFTYEVDYLF